VSAPLVGPTIIVTDYPRPCTVPEHRPACDHCGGRDGVIYQRSGQIVVRCANPSCSSFNHNFGRGDRIYCPSKAELGVPATKASDAREPFPPGLRWKVLERDSCRCVFCGRTASSDVVLHAAHLISVKDGLDAGISAETLNSEENLVTACDRCNLGMRADSIEPRLLLLLKVREARRRKAS
jgi:hypothetical protein